VLAQRQLGGDLVVGQRPRDQPEHLDLPLAQRRQARRRLPARQLTGEAVQQPRSKTSSAAAACTTITDTVCAPARRAAPGVTGQDGGDLPEPADVRGEHLEADSGQDRDAHAGSGQRRMKATSRD
jgi:hypothetical protein